MKKNRPNEIRKSIDSLTALLICAEKEREWLAGTLDIMIIQPQPSLHIANERELSEIASAYKQDIVRTALKPYPFNGLTSDSLAYALELSIEVNGIKLYTLA